MGDLEHIDVGPRLTKVAWELTTAHHLASQAVGDVIYASTTAQLAGLAIGTDGQVFQVSAAGIPAWSSIVRGGDGALGAPTYTFQSEPTTGMFLQAAGVLGFTLAAAEQARWAAGALTFQVAMNIAIIANANLTIGTPAGTGDLLLQANGGTLVALDGGLDGLGFYGTAAVAQQTGVAVSAAAIHAALVNLGLITA